MSSPVADIAIAHDELYGCNASVRFHPNRLKTAVIYGCRIVGNWLPILEYMELHIDDVPAPVNITFDRDSMHAEIPLILNSGFCMHAVPSIGFLVLTGILTGRARAATA